MAPPQDAEAEQTVQTSGEPEYLRQMQRADFYPHPTGTIFLQETHISRVFLTGDLVYKVKKPVDLGFLDFTTLEKRKHYCRREVELNQRLTRDVYLGVVALTREEDGLQLEGAGPAEEYAVQMRQLDSRQLLENMLPEKVETEAVSTLARKLARFYEKAPTGGDIDRFGASEVIAQNCRENFRQLGRPDQIGDSRAYLPVIEGATHDFLENKRKLLEKRIEEGKIRDGHGDLRPDHIYFTDQGVQIIDCIEFNQRFRCADVACDLAFLAMSLDFQDFSPMSGSLMAAFFEHSGDRRMFALLDFYKCYRAMVRLKVNYMRLQQGNLKKTQRDELGDRMHRYLELAYRYAVRFSRPVLWVVCGPVASGKSTLAEALAEALDIRVFRSDVLRKQLFPQEGRQKADSRDFEEGMYAPQATALTYGRLLLAAQKEIEGGSSVVLDATFSGRDKRKEALRLGEQTGVRVVFLECACSRSTVQQRLRQRQGGNSVSDARLRHLQELMRAYEPPAEIPPSRRWIIDSDCSLTDNLSRLFAHMSNLNFS